MGEFDDGRIPQNFFDGPLTVVSGNNVQMRNKGPVTKYFDSWIGQILVDINRTHSIANL